MSDRPYKKFTTRVHPKTDPHHVFYDHSKRNRDEKQKTRERLLELARLRREVELMKRTVMNRDGTFKKYGQARNTANQGITLGEEIPPQGKEGPPGPRGAQGFKGDKGDSGDTGSRGLSGYDGNADFMMIQCIGSTSSSFNEVGHLNWRVSGSTDMLADPYVIRQQGTSGSIHWGQHTVVTVGMLFKPGVYRVTLNARRRRLEEAAMGFDNNHNGVISYSYSQPNEEPYSMGNFDCLTRLYTYTITNNSMFYLIERLPSVEGQHWAQLGSPPQLIFEKIGNVEFSGTDDTLRNYAGMPSPNATVLLTGDFDWAVPGGAAPPVGYHPNDHPDNGGTNEWAVIEKAADSGSTALAWIHRVRRFI